MSQLENKQELQDPTEALLFIRGVLSATREGKDEGGALGALIAAGITIAAGVGTWWMSKSGLSGIVPLIWAVHNLAILSMMAIDRKRAKSASRRDWQLLSIWIMTILFMWASSILVFFGVMRAFAVPGLILIFVSLGGTACGIVLWDKMTAAISAALVIGVPFVLIYPQSGYLIAISLLVIWIFIGVLVEKRRFKKARYGR